MDPILLKPAEVARLLGIGRSKVYELIGNRTLKSIRLGKCVRVPAESLHEWVQAQLASSAHRDADPSETRSGPR